MPDYYIGLMSGTSIDAIDAVLVRDSEDTFQVIGSHEESIPKQIQNDILSLCSPGNNEINRMGKLDNQLALLFSQASQSLLAKNHMEAKNIRAIGSHGQTIRHHPNGEFGFTLQIGNPALIAEQCNITTVADFRRADIAAGGQGAPLVPAFHRAVFASPDKNRVIINIGGMANISILENNQVKGFDTGPGNVLLNAWAEQNLNQPYDKNGDWARSNTINHELLKKLLDEPYFQDPPPKSTGRELFNLEWLQAQINKLSLSLDAGTIQTTLTELTVQTIAADIQQYAKVDETYVCGGGAFNCYLIERLEIALAMPVRTTQDLGIDPSYVEAAAFAWFAKQTLNGCCANEPDVTGANHPVIMGAIYPRSPSGI